MKYKVIALAVSGALLAACGSDNDNRVDAPTGSSTNIQAFDGAVRRAVSWHSANRQNHHVAIR